MKESQHNSQLELVTVTDVICYKRVRSYIHKMTFLKPIRYTCTQAQQGRLLAVASFAQEALVGRSVTVSGCQCGQLPEINYPRDHILGSKIFPRWPLRYPPQMCGGHHLQTLAITDLASGTDSSQPHSTNTKRTCPSGMSRTFCESTRRCS